MTLEFMQDRHRKIFFQDILTNEDQEAIRKINKEGISISFYIEGIRADFSIGNGEKIYKH